LVRFDVRPGVSALDFFAGNANLDADKNGPYAAGKTLPAAKTECFRLWQLRFVDWVDWTRT
jgi:hypothetical protein